MSSQFTNEVDMTEFSSRGKLILTFHDVRNAVLAAERCRILIPGALSVFLNAAGKSARHFLSDQADVENGPGDDSSKFEGEFVVAVSLIDPFEQHVAPGALENVAKDVVEKFGIKASQRLRVDPRGITMRIELFDVRPTHSKIFEAHDRRFGVSSHCLWSIPWSMADKLLELLCHRLSLSDLASQSRRHWTFCASSRQSQRLYPWLW